MLTGMEDEVAIEIGDGYREKRTKKGMNKVVIQEQEEIWIIVGL